MPLYLDKLTTAEVRTVIRNLEADIRKKKKANLNWNPSDGFVFAPSRSSTC